MFLFVDCCCDITLNKHSTMVTNTWDDLNLDDKTVVVRQFYPAYDWL